jgi:hypothetical protein
MKNNENINKIHNIDKKPIPKDFHEVKQELLSDKLKEEEIVNLGQNRGQYFIRIPTRISRMMSLNPEDKIRIIAESQEGIIDVRLEIIKGDKDA